LLGQFELQEPGWDQESACRLPHRARYRESSRRLSKKPRGLLCPLLATTRDGSG